MNIEQFYDEDPARRASTEFEYGTAWSDPDGGRVELSWVEATGELYTMREPVEPLVADMFGDERLQKMPTDLLTVEVLGVVATRSELDRLLAGWGNAMATPTGLAWVRDRLEHGPAARDAHDVDSPDLAFATTAPDGSSVIIVAAIKAFFEHLPRSAIGSLVVFHEGALVAGSDPTTEWHRAYACARWAEKMVSIPAHSHLAVEAVRAVEIVRELGVTIGAELRDLEYLPFGKAVSPRFQTELAWVYEAVHVATRVADKSGWDDVPWAQLFRDMLDIAS